MGLIFYDAKRLWEASLSGVSFERTLTVGHQQLFLHPSELKALRRAYQARPPRPLASPLANYQFGEYADRFCREFLGVTALESIDYSAYEGATIIHDMNKPIPESLRGRFDALIEAGSLEHIFNFPVAVENLMQMVKVGGTVFLTTVANNQCGHGFYQFSPELIYRVFSAENGFESGPVVFLEATFPGVEETPIRRAYTVVDPISVGCRVGLVSRRPIMMAVEARKIKNARPFAVAPQQSDYTVAWNGGMASSAGKTAKLVRRIMKKLPLYWRRKLHGYYSNWKYSLRNRRFYRNVS